MKDIRYEIFKNVLDCKYKAEIVCQNNGIFSGRQEVIEMAKTIEIDLSCIPGEGESIRSGQVVGIVSGSPINIAIAEEKLIGCMAKYSGIATAARRAVETADQQFKIVAGSWKKMPPQLKSGVRTAVAAGGGHFRISETPMIYLDKNFIRILGGIRNTLESVKEMNEFVKVIQIKGIDQSIDDETKEAMDYGADLLMIDTGNKKDIDVCRKIVETHPREKEIKIAFAGDVSISEIDEFKNKGLDILCIGKEIVDARLLDMKLDIVEAI